MTGRRERKAVRELNPLLLLLLLLPELKLLLVELLMHEVVLALELPVLLL